MRDSLTKHMTGTVFWITGLAGSGKTTIGRRLYDRLKEMKPDVVFLDGDTLRGVFGNSHGHSPEDRKKLAMSYSRLCRLLSDQGIDVVCSTISLFREVHKFNRENFRNYCEIFVDCDMKEIVRRDQKGLYSNCVNGSTSNVIGVDLEYDEPENCDLVIDNSRQDSLDEKVERIMQLNKKGRKQ